MNKFTENYFEKAYRLAWFLHPSKEQALVIARNALARLEVTSNAQFKRYYYQPTGRAGKQGKTHRSKVNLAEPHLLQRLLYIESDGIEREQEASDAPLNQEDMVIRFTKHLVKQTLRRNSFYVTLGVGRLLHNYNTHETMDMFALIVQDPERVRDDFYYRSRKKRLMKEIQDRFGNLLSVVRGFRGEQRFKTMEKPGHFKDLIEECLRRFTPWDTDCVVHEKPDRFAREIPGLTFKANDPDEEHAIEINRIHTVLHPDCFHRICDSLKLESPDQRLAAPLFNLAVDKPPSSGNRKDPTPLEAYDVHNTDQFLEDQKQRRKDSRTSVFHVKVDGRNLARIHPGPFVETRFQIPDDADLIEIYSQDNVLLAAHLITNPEEDASYETVLDNGWEFCFHITGQSLEADEDSHINVMVSFHDPARKPALADEISAPARVADASLWRRFLNATGFTGPGSLIPALAPVVMAFLIASFLYYTMLIKPKPDTPVTHPAHIGQEPPPSHQTGPGQTRDLVVATPGLSLSAISAISVGSLGEEKQAEELRDAVIWALGETQRFTTPTQIADADAVLKYIESEEETPGKRPLHLVNEKGDILWTAMVPLNETTDIKALAGQLVGALILEADK